MIDPEEFLKRHPVVIPEDDETDAPSDAKPRLRPAMGQGTAHELPTPRARARGPEHGNAPHRDALPGEHTPAQARLSDGAADCLEAALRSLEAAGASEQGLRERLRRKGFEKSAIDSTVRILLGDGVLDDEEYARSIYRRCLERFMGPYGVRRELRGKGIGQDIIEALIREGEADGSFEASAENLANDVCAKSRGLDYTRRLGRIASASRRKGQSASLVMSYARPLLADDHGSDK